MVRRETNNKSKTRKKKAPTWHNTTDAKILRLFKLRNNRGIVDSINLNEACIRTILELYFSKQSYKFFRTLTVKDPVLTLDMALGYAHKT